MQHYIKQPEHEVEVEFDKYNNPPLPDETGIWSVLIICYRTMQDYLKQQEHGVISVFEN